MYLQSYKVRIVVLITLVLTLCQCAQTVNSPAQQPQVVKKTSDKSTNPYKLSVASYIALSKQQQGQEQQNSLLSAAGRSLSDGQWQQARAILAQTKQLSAQQLTEKNLLLAKIDIMRSKPNKALVKLASITSARDLSTYQQIQFHELLAQAYRSTHNSIESVKQRIQLEALLENTESQTNNRKSLWVTLINLSPAELHTLIAQAQDHSDLQGWLHLALIAKQHRNNQHSLLAALKQWQSNYRTHPANQMLPTPLDAFANKMLVKPKKVALLLPLSGILAGPGTAIRDGFMAAAKDKKNKPEIALYDTNNNDIASLYQKAIAEGAEYVVGPLTKAQVTVVAGMEHPVPTLLLNDTEGTAQENSYLFGLSPASEAVQVALHAKSKGYSHALIIAPNNDWGLEVTKAFTAQWQAQEGKIVDSLLYANNENLDKSMKDFLHVSDSLAREKQLKQLLGQDLLASTSRRQDFDVVFLLAYPSKARQIIPLLRYYYAGDIPVYATSSVYSGNANALKDKDLDGVIFCDIPWVFAHQMGNKNWPEQFNSYNRLYALGKDSYALARQLNQLMLFPADTAKQGGGTLYLKNSYQVSRVLEWGQFKQGLVHSLGDAA